MNVVTSMTLEKNIDLLKRINARVLLYINCDAIPSGEKVKSQKPCTMYEFLDSTDTLKF